MTAFLSPFVPCETDMRNIDAELAERDKAYDLIGC